MKHQREIVGDYNAGHPWYYLLGNPVLSLKQIRDNAKASTCRGYMAEDIIAASKKAEPKRSQAIVKFRLKIMEDLRQDISIYRKYAFQLHVQRREHHIPDHPRSCDDIHTSMSLKHNHIYNGFVHLALLDELPEQQGDLFGF